MTYRYILILGLFLTGIMSASRCECGSPQGSTPAQATAHAQSETKVDSEVQATDPPIFHVDFSDTNLSTPESAAASFVQFYNGILPITTNTIVQEICEKLVVSSCQKGCQELLGNRLNHIKSIAINLEGAGFRTHSPAKLSTDPMQIKTSWQEKLSFVDGSTKVSDKNMILTLEKLDNEWKVNNIKEIDSSTTTVSSPVKAIK